MLVLLSASSGGEKGCNKRERSPFQAGPVLDDERKRGRESGRDEEEMKAPGRRATGERSMHFRQYKNVVEETKREQEH